MNAGAGNARTGAVRVVSTAAVAPGFELAGFSPTTAGPESAAAALESTARAEGTAIILLQSDLYEAAAGPALRRLERAAHPVVLPFPGPRWTERPAADTYVVELLRRAIGYRVRLR